MEAEQKVGLPGHARKSVMTSRVPVSKIREGDCPLTAALAWLLKQASSAGRKS
jgi:hypothetical protein